jgi:hypothetical protein
MKRTTFLATLTLILAVLLTVAGCDKEKIVESTEYIEQIEYITLPPDTVFRTDTVHHFDTVVHNDSVTIQVTDTVIQIDYVYDTVIQVSYIHDTITVYDTVNSVQFLFDTLYFFDTTYIIDTVTVNQSGDNEHVAIGGLQYHSNGLVIEFISAEFGYTDGWIFYLSTMQSDIVRVSSGVYDIYGFIDYWTPDWAAYYPLEYYWRISYTGGDPADPANWQISEPPDASPTHEPGLKVVSRASDRSLR